MLKIDQEEFASEEARRRGNRVGEWTDQYWGLMTDGLFSTMEEIQGWADQDGKNNATILPGDIRYIDYNGDGRITNDDRVIIGRGDIPRFTYGLNAAVAWKGFDFNMLWQGAGLYNFDLRRAPDLRLPFYAGNTPQVAWFEGSWTPENPWMPANTTDAKWPRYRTDGYNRGHRNFNTNSDFWLTDGSYIRLKNVQLGYTLPAKLIQNWGVSSLKFYVSGYNLLTFSALDFLDPEADTRTERVFGDYYPPTGTYNLGALLQF